MDRLKREDFSDEVLSKVIINKFSKERDLLNCYKTGFKVFEMSISGLEFVIKNVEDEIIEISIDEDNNKLTQFAETICENVENERNIDLNQQILSDEASFRGSFKNFNYENSEKLEMDLEDKFLNFYNSFHQKYCNNRAFVRTNEIVTFKPDDLPKGTLNILENSYDQGFINKRVGTFRRRKLAQGSRKSFLLLATLSSMLFFE